MPVKRISSMDPCQGEETQKAGLLEPREESFTLEYIDVSRITANELWMLCKLLESSMDV